MRRITKPGRRGFRAPWRRLVSDQPGPRLVRWRTAARLGLPPRRCPKRRRASETDTLSQFFARRRLLAVLLLVGRRMKNLLNSSVLRQVEKFCFPQNFAVRSLLHWPWAVRAELTGCSAPLCFKLHGPGPAPFLRARTASAVALAGMLLVAVLPAAAQLPPSIIRQPADQTARGGDTVVLQVEATANPALA